MVIVDATRHPRRRYRLVYEIGCIILVPLVCWPRSGCPDTPAHRFVALGVKHTIRYYPRHVSGNCNKYPDIKRRMHTRTRPNFSWRGSHRTHHGSCLAIRLYSACNAPCGPRKPRGQVHKILLYIDSGRANTQRRASHAGMLQRTKDTNVS